jgi:hypothetical protein
MNCQDFENNLDGLARGALMDSRARETALAHERSCARCAARLRDERAVASGLRALADATKDACAPARVESALLASLRAQVASSAARESNESVVQLSVNENVRQFSWVKTVAVAALAAAAAVALFMLIPPSMSVPASKTKDTVAETHTTGQKLNDAQSGAREAATMKDESSEGIASTNASEGVAATSDEGGGQSLNNSTVVEGSVGSRGAVVRHTPRAIRGTTVGLNTGGGAQSFSETSATSEITTDFIPLMQGARLTQADGVRMVRIDLPRSALARFGLPVNAERTDGRVKADVLLGEDGLARAIRFVR